jgi:hypothetical protein
VAFMRPPLPLNSIIFLDSLAGGFYMGGGCVSLALPSVFVGWIRV